MTAAALAAAHDAIAALDGRTVATAESLTAGLVSATLAAVPGVSAILRGGVVAYCSEVKETVLGVPAAVLAEGGPVQAAVAEANIVVANLLFIEEHLTAILPTLTEVRPKLDAMVGMIADPQIVKLK